MNNGAAQPDGLLEITNRLSAYQNPETTRELYDFGKLLLQEGVDRAHWLDSKAGVMAGFSGAIFALLLSTFANWKSALENLPFAFRPVVFAGVVLILFASIFSLLGLAVRRYDWLDENRVWLAQEYLEFPDLLERYYLIAMYRSIVSHDRKNGIKSNYLAVAQWLLIVGGMLLALALLAIVWAAIMV